MGLEALPAARGAMCDRTALCTLLHISVSEAAAAATAAARADILVLMLTTLFTTHVFQAA